MSDTTTVCFATLSAGQPLLAHVNSLLEIHPRTSLGPEFEVVNVITAQSGPYLDVGRNDLVANALAQSTADWFIWLDDDVQFTPDAARTLLSTAITMSRDFASGPYASWDPIFGPCIVAYRLTDFDPDIHPEKIEPHRLADGRFFHPIPLDACPTAPTDVSSFGAGFMATSRVMLEDMQSKFANPQPWFAEQVIPGVNGGIWLGEDHIFCMRAHHIGYPPLLVPDAKVTHIKRTHLQIPDPTRTYDPESPTLVKNPDSP